MRGMSWHGLGLCSGVTLLDGDVKLVLHPMCDAYGCCSGVGDSSTAPALTVPFLAWQLILPQGAAQLSRGKMRCKHCWNVCKVFGIGTALVKKKFLGFA